jgi:hypothetical protein
MKIYNEKGEKEIRDFLNAYEKIMKYNIKA